MPTPPTTEEQILERLDAIAEHLKHLDSRDKARMIWSWFHSLISLGLLIFALWGSWYLMAHIGDYIKIIAQEAAIQSQQMMKNGSSNFVNQVQNLFQK